MPGRSNISDDMRACAACGRPVRGPLSAPCSNCGERVPVRLLKYLDHGQFDRARLVLQRSKVAFSSEDPARGMAGMAGILAGIATPAVIQIAADEFETAIGALFEANVHVPLPLVDCREPVCPGCGRSLPVGRSAPCEHCDQEFLWVEVDEPAVGPPAQCHRCGYELAGNQSGDCPECGTVIRRNLEGQVARASGENDCLDQARTSGPTLWNVAVQVVAWVTIIGIVVFILWVIRSGQQ